jgi:hypothetical protein
LDEGLLRAGQVSGLERLPDGSEVLLTLGHPEYKSVARRAVLPQTLDGLECLLSGGKVPGPKRLAQLLQTGIALLDERLHPARKRTRGNSCC